MLLLLFAVQQQRRGELRSDVRYHNSEDIHELLLFILVFWYHRETSALPALLTSQRDLHVVLAGIQGLVYVAVGFASTSPCSSIVPFLNQQPQQKGIITLSSLHSFSIYHCLSPPASSPSLSPQRRTLQTKCPGSKKFAIPSLIL